VRGVASGNHLLTYLLRQSLMLIDRVSKQQVWDNGQLIDIIRI